ncbi:DoxX family protein [Gordonia humi]|uniref:Putative membrane protein YphA (DoxX/SURF4 family) n=1 Tax=Gordonia humi TaxID=686429 RepID=A0A840F4F4_9ACTN|nr:DoxX family protein [Gordonia humi]MBB4136776.1 putative membrane protein YphA (DoxX/SURF4 family) [Gordonia humi]
MILRRIARPLLGVAFITSGVEAVRSPSGPARTAEPLLDSVPANTETVIRAAGVVQVGAGVALAVGKAPRLASTVLAGTLVPTTVFASDFWNESDPARKSAKQTEFVKNIGLLGGALLASADTEGRPSLGWRGRRGLVRTRDAVADALPSRSESSHRLNEAADRAEHWAHDVADRLPVDAVADRAAHYADAARSQAYDVASTVADRAPGVIDSVRDHAESLASEIADRAPDAATRARELAEESGKKATRRVSRLRKQLTA